METMMASAPPQPKTGGIGRRLARLLRRKRSPSGGGMAYSVAGDEFDPQSLDSSISSLSKLKLSGNLAAAYSFDALFRNAAAEKKVAEQAAAAADAGKHAFAAGLFAGASAVKAAYAQLQLAQHPYDAAAIQAADAGVVAELTKLSELKRRYARDPAAAAAARSPASSALAAQADEQRHLLRTYEITMRKLEADLKERDAAAEQLAGELRAALEERPGRALAALDGLHLSGLNATHFLTALRHAVKSVRAFAKTMLASMSSAGWDPVAAAAAVHPCVRLRHAGDARFAVESFVALKMFANFQRKDFGLRSNHGGGSHVDRRRFFEEFAELKSAPASSFLDAGDASGRRWGAFREFLRERYLSLVHERMETAFFGRADQRAALMAGAIAGEAASSSFPRTAWFGEFAEMARRVWLLHRLFCAFDGAASVFQARPGSRFSEVYMESVTGDDDGICATATPSPDAGRLAVGFTVVPGFKVGQTVIQCRVYLSRPDHGRPGRPDRGEAC